MLNDKASLFFLTVLLLLVLLEVGLFLESSTLARPLAIGLVLLVPPNTLMVLLKLKWPASLSRGHFAILSSLLFFLWLIGVILLLSVYRWFQV